MKSEEFATALVLFFTFHIKFFIKQEYIKQQTERMADR